MRNRIFFFMLTVFAGMGAVQAATPTYNPGPYDAETYYASAEGLSGKALLTKLFNIVGSHTNVGYDGLYTVYSKSDVTPDNYVWDMYSTCKFTPITDKCGNYKNIGDCYNREHGVPQGWFNKATPMKNDAFHVIPTDGRVNGQRSDYSYGECEGGTVLPANGENRSLCRLGTSTYPGYTGMVFEPDDQYKGDIARMYFYMAAAYNNLIGTWSTARGSLAGNNYPVFTTWMTEMLLKWHRQDPVSQKEVDRNNAIWGYQHNRNPFVDFPELAEYVWGNKVGEGWQPGNTSAEPIITSPATGYHLDLGVCRTGGTLTGALNVKGFNLTETLNVTITGSEAVGTLQASTTTISAADALAGTTLNFTYSSTTAAADVFTVTIGNTQANTIVSVSAQAIDGIPALPATDVTESGFTAHWTNVDEASATYVLYVQEAGGASVQGFPTRVSAADEQYVVSGLDPLTEYTYYLTTLDAAVQSNTVSVTTLDLTRILAFVAPASGFVITTEPGAESPMLEASVYTENVFDDVTLEAEGNFEVSLDGLTWLQQLAIDSEGETFYVRIKDTNAEGTYVGLLSLSTPTIEGEEIEITGMVVPTATFVEDWEEATSGGYWTSQVQGTMCSWDFVDAGIWGSSSDRHNGALAVRLGKSATSSIAMAEDKAGGAGTVTFMAGAFGNDSEATIQLLVSNDGGTEWVSKGGITAPAGEAQEFTIVVNTPGNVRIKLQQTSGNRVNIDDIAISNYIEPSAIEEAEAKMARTWQAVPTKGGITLQTAEPTMVEVYDLRAACVARVRASGSQTIALPAGIYVVSANGQSKKVVVK